VTAWNNQSTETAKRRLVRRTRAAMRVVAPWWHL
jgi:hypothetical protein